MSPAAGGTRGGATLWLALATGAFALASGLAGWLWSGPGQPRTFTSLHGQAVELFGSGLYRNDSVFAAGNNRGSDLVMLLLGLPLLAVSVRLHRAGSLRGRLLLLGTMGFFLYAGASYALGAVAYNEMFLVYVGLFAASLFGFIAVFASFDESELERAIPGGMPRRLPGAFMIASGLATLAIWVVEPVIALTGGDPPPSLEARTTLFTTALDIGVIVPAALLSGAMILRRRVFGYVVAFSLLVLEALLMPMITIATIVQVRSGVSFAPGEIAGPIAGFTVLAVLAIWVIVALLRRLRPA